MPPRLPEAQIDRICARLRAGDTVRSIVADEDVSARCVRNYASNLTVFDSPHSSSITKMGRPKLLAPGHLAILEDWLLGRPESYLDEMQYFLWDQFNITCYISTIKRSLDSADHTRKRLKKKASERCPELR